VSVFSREKLDIFDVVENLADLVERRAADGKNWGVVLIPEGLLSFLPSTRQLMKEAAAVGNVREKRRRRPFNDRIFQEHSSLRGRTELPGCFT
jgi:hypothetical protein